MLHSCKLYYYYEYTETARWGLAQALEVLTPYGGSNQPQLARAAYSWVGTDTNSSRTSETAACHMHSHSQQLRSVPKSDENGDTCDVQ